MEKETSIEESSTKKQITTKIDKEMVIEEQPIKKQQINQIDEW